MSQDIVPAYTLVPADHYYPFVQVFTINYQGEDLNERGGIMAGWVDDIGNVTVTHVSGPGPKALKTSTRFEKDVEFCQKFLDDLYLESNQKATYVGEWHSHPSSDNHPSGTDIKSLSEIAVERNYLTACPAMIIFSNTGQPSCTLHPAGKRYYFADLYFMKNQ